MEDQILSQLNNLSTGTDKILEKFGLNHNPFPKSGIASVSDKSEIVGKLIPVKKDTLDTILNYIKDALKRKVRTTTSVSLCVETTVQEKLRP